MKPLFDRAPVRPGNALNFCRPQSRSWSARRDGIAHSVRQEGRRYRLRRRAIDNALFIAGDPHRNDPDRPSALR